MRKQKLLVIVGPTASGKSELAIRLAKRFNGEIVSADSRQVYRGMDIGTGKVTKAQRRAIPHHLLDVADPRRPITVVQYQRLARRAIRDILRRNKLPILVGGTGLYIHAVVDAVTYPAVPPNVKLRQKLERLPSRRLFTMLKRLDPNRAERIDRHNPRRLIRAIEIAKALGRVPKPAEKGSVYDVLLIGLNPTKEELRRRIHERLLARLQKGLVAEVRRLKRQRLSPKRLEAFGLEYRYVNRFLEGKLSRQEMIEQLETAIWQYSRRQMTWLRNDMRIRWVSSPAQANPLVKNFLEKA